MSRTCFAIGIGLTLLLFGPARLSAGESESRPSAALLDEAQSLMQIYLKLRFLGSSLEGPELKDSLDAMNRGLDKVLAFRDAFTPQKRAKLESQLKNLQKDSEKLVEQHGKQLKKELPKLADQLLQLVKTLQE